ncbi:MAG: 50S ribosomal protein L20 [Candidatus Cloacimonetes bacterium]|nr:50S ribosomal protein L20 [Candidatus Cloacimonadota bacterium]
MSRAVNNVAAKKRRKKYLKAAKGYFGARSRQYRVARQAVEKGWLYAYRDRKNRKREFRKLWILRINAAARLNGLTYSAFINGLNKANVDIDRKALAFLAMNDPDAFVKLCDLVKSNAN